MSASLTGVAKHTICGWLGYTRQAHHRARRRRHARAVDAEFVVQLTHQIRQRAGARLGAGKVFAEARGELKALGIKCGRDRLYDILRAGGLLLAPKKSRVRTTDSSAWMRQFDDLRADFVPTGPDQLWVADITYVKCAERKLYLSLITDAYARKIVGWRLHADLSTAGCSRALEAALRGRVRPRNRIIHHSDRGCQYCSRAYVRTLRSHGLRISTTQNGSPYENPLAESVNGQLKVEYDLDQVYATETEARAAVAEAIAKYNEYRPHGALGGRKPSQLYTVHPEAG